MRNTNNTDHPETQATHSSGQRRHPHQQPHHEAQRQQLPPVRGTKDTIYIFSESIARYVLTINREHGTIGLASYMSPEPFPNNSFYMHSLKETQNLFGQQWEQLPALDITLKLIDCLM